MDGMKITYTEIWAWHGKKKAEAVAAAAAGGVWRGTLGELLYLLGWRPHAVGGRR